MDHHQYEISCVAARILWNMFPLSIGSFKTTIQFRRHLKLLHNSAVI